MHQHTRSILLASLACVSAWAGTVQAQSVTRYVVKGNADAAHPYNAWTNAAPDIQTAIDAASAANGDEVVVAPGTYDSGGRPHTGLALTNRVVIDKAITVRSRDNDPATAIIRGAWDAGTNGPAAVRPVYMVAGAELRGFTLTNGATLASGATDDLIGGGVWAFASTSVLSNCVITGNSAVGATPSHPAGGGMIRGTLYNCTVAGNFSIGRGAGAAGSGSSSGVTVHLHDCTVSNNTSSTVGGGVYLGDAYDCLIVGNHAAQKGGGMYHGTLYDCVVVGNVALAADAQGGGMYWGDAYRCVVSNNVSGYGGGGIAGLSTILAKVVDSLVASNSAGYYGGGVLYAEVSNSVISNNYAFQFGGGCRDSQVTDSRIVENYASSGGGAVFGVYTRCIFARNRAGASGGGVYLVTCGDCLIVGNQSGYNGGGVQGGSGATLVTNCTIIGNYAASRGGGVYVSGTMPIVNSIVYGNDAPTDGPNWYNATASTFSHSCTVPAVAGWDASNLAVDPKFVDAGSGYGLDHVAGNYRLSGASPCLNAGLNEPWMEGAVDLDGNPRVDRLTGNVDMGCYETVFRGTTLLVR